MKRENEPIRQASKIALSAGRYFQSPNTGFVHYSYDIHETDYDTIPLVDNFLWVLTLLRTKQRDPMQEAFVLLQRLLFYEENGAFPRYLHEAPECKDRYLSAHLLAPMFRIWQGFKKVLPDEIKERLFSVIERVCDRCVQLCEKEFPPYQLRVKIGCGLIAFARDKGQNILQECQEKGVTESWFSPDHLGDILVSLSMIYPNLENSPWKSLWFHVTDMWYRPTASFVGPALFQRQQASEPQATILDLYMGMISTQYSQRAIQVHPYHLQAALLYEMEHTLPTAFVPHAASGTFLDKEGEKRTWRVMHFSDYALGIMEMKKEEERSHQYRVIPFQLHWGDMNRVHTFCLQGGNVNQLKIKELEQKKVELEVVVSELEDPKKDLSFYLDGHEGLKKSVEQKACSTFELGERIELQAVGLALGLTMQIENRQGRYQGTIHPGNRPSQMKKKGQDRFLAFDKEIVLRCVQRKGPETLKVTIEIL